MKNGTINPDAPAEQLFIPAGWKDEDGRQPPLYTAAQVAALTAAPNAKASIHALSQINAAQRELLDAMGAHTAQPAAPRPVAYAELPESYQSSTLIVGNDGCTVTFHFGTGDEADVESWLSAVTERASNGQAPAAPVTVEQVEDAIGLQSTAWDTIGAEKIVEAVLRLANGQAPAGAVLYPGCSHWGMRDTPATAQAAPAAERQYINGVKTVADLVNNLLLLDQSLPIYAAQHIQIANRRRTITVPPTVSLERVKDERWIGDGDELNAAVIWTRAEAPAAGAVAGPVETIKFSDGSTADPVEKARRYLHAMADHRINSQYFFDDGWPKKESAIDAMATLAVLEQLAAAPTPAAQADRVLEDAARYQHLRHCDLDDMEAKYWPGGQVPTGEAFDAAVDAARKQGGV